MIVPSEYRNVLFAMDLKSDYSVNHCCTETKTGPAERVKICFLFFMESHDVAGTWLNREAEEWNSHFITWNDKVITLVCTITVQKSSIIN